MENGPVAMEEATVPASSGSPSRTRREATGRTADRSEAHPRGQMTQAPSRATTLAATGTEAGTTATRACQPVG